MEDQFQQLVKDGIAALNAGNTSLALRHLRRRRNWMKAPNSSPTWPTAWQRKKVTSPVPHPSAKTRSEMNHGIPSTI